LNKRKRKLKGRNQEWTIQRRREHWVQDTEGRQHNTDN